MFGGSWGGDRPCPGRVGFPTYTLFRTLVKDLRERNFVLDSSEKLEQLRVTARENHGEQWGSIDFGAIDFIVSKVEKILRV